MSAQLNQDVQDAIAKNLPALAAAELKTFLAQAEKDKADLQIQKDKIGSLQAQVIEQQARITAQNELTQRESALAAGQAKLQADQLAFAFKEAKLAADVAIASRDATLNVVGMFLKVPEIRTTIQRNVALPVEGTTANQYNSYSSPGAVVQAQESETKTTTQE